MSAQPAWLPPLALLADYDGDWNRYLEAIYEHYRRDFVTSRPNFEDKRVAPANRTLASGKESTFWHLISEGKVEEKRLPDIRRCERIRWPRPIIDSSSTNSVRAWRNLHKKQRRVVIALDDFSYVVVLIERKKYALLVTAYLVSEEHQRSKLRKEYEAQNKAGAAAKWNDARTPSTHGG
jgi:hypothetical protein